MWKRALMFGILLVLAGLGGCIEEHGHTTEGYTLTDDHGRNVTFPETPQRVISIAPSTTEIIYFLGAGDRVVALDNNSNYPEGLDKPRVYGYKWMNLEKIISLKPDVIFAADINSADIPVLEENDLRVFVLSADTVEGVLADIELAGKVLGIDEVGKEKRQELEQRYSEVLSKIRTADTRPKVYLELDDTMGYWTYGPGTFGDQLITLAGGENIAHDADTQYPALQAEEIISRNPDIIIYQTGPWSTTTAEEIKAREGWSSISAVKNDRITGVDGDIISRPGPRIIDGLEALAKAIHPEVFTD